MEKKKKKTLLKTFKLDMKVLLKMSLACRRPAVVSHFSGNKVSVLSLLSPVHLSFLLLFL